VPFNKVQYLKKAYDLLQQPITQLLQDLKPDWVFYDFAPYWVGSIGKQLGIKTVFFSIVTAAFLAFLGPATVLMGDDDRTKPEDFTVPPKWVPFDTEVAYKYHEIKTIFESIEGDVSGVSDLYRFGKGLQDCDIVAARSCSEFEPEWLRVLNDIYKKPVFPIGQLPTTAYEIEGDSTESTTYSSWASIQNWLDKQSKGSIVYVAFGSEAKPSQAQLTELALGLERSELPFFWVLRTNRGSTDTELIELPPGFKSRVEGRGVVWTSWVPQLKILSHDSVGGILTHSGWSSVVEAMQFGRAVIMLTFLADQGINARILEEKKIGYSIPRNELNGSFTSESVAESVRLVMVEEEGEGYREKAKEMQKLFGDRDKQNTYVDCFLTYLIKHSPNTKLG
jgi:hypothetical protein